MKEFLFMYLIICFGLIALFALFVTGAWVGVPVLGWVFTGELKTAFDYTAPYKWLWVYRAVPVVALLICVFEWWEQNAPTFWFED